MFENVIEAMIDAVLVVDVEGTVTLSNAAAIRLTGFTAEQLRHMPIGQLLVDDDSGLRTVVRKRIEDGDVLRRQGAWLSTASGDRIPVSVTGSPVIADGKFQGIVLVARDIREIRRLLAEKEAEIEARRAAEAELRTLNASIEEKLEQTRASLLLAERRATLGTLAGGVGHELRNIAQIHVAAMDELEEALEEGRDVTDLARSVLPDLRRVGEHITAHGQRLMQLARPGPDRVVPLDLRAVVQDVVAMLQWAGKLRRVEIELDLGDAPVTVTVNRTRIEQILVNLVGNAVDAIEGAGGAGKVSIRVAPVEGRASCTVSDTGPGIHPEHLERIFQAFFTTKEEGRGTGLGLPVAREIVESYGGTLTVETELGKGTTFRFDLPAL